MTSQDFEKRSRPKLISIFVIVALLVSIVLVVPVSAAAPHGSLVFTHGVNPAANITFAKTTSTAVEDSMRLRGYVDIFSGPYAGNRIIANSPTCYNASSIILDINVGDILGRSYFYYYVDGSEVHRSTAWWYFDFR